MDKILIIGGSIGTLPYFTKRVFKEMVNVTTVEDNEKLKEIGYDYFGFDSVEYEWKHTSGIKFLRSKIDHNKEITKNIHKENNKETEKTQNNTNENEGDKNQQTNKKNKNKNKNKGKLIQYDLILINENNYSTPNKVSPHSDYLTFEFLESIKVRFLLYL